MESHAVREVKFEKLRMEESDAEEVSEPCLLQPSVINSSTNNYSSWSTKGRVLSHLRVMRVMGYIITAVVIFLLEHQFVDNDGVNTTPDHERFNVNYLTDSQRVDYYVPIVTNMVPERETCFILRHSICEFLKLPWYRNRANYPYDKIDPLDYLNDTCTFMKEDGFKGPILVRFGDKTSIYNDSIVFHKARFVGSSSSLLPFKAFERHFPFRDNKDIPWNKKFDSAIWVGASTGCYLYAQTGVVSRLSFVKENYNKSNHKIYFSKVDTRKPQCRGAIAYARGCFSGIRKCGVDVQEQLKYKYIVSLPGNDVASNTGWILNSNSVLVMPKPEKEIWFMYGLLQPFVHYIPIFPSQQDIDKVLEYCDAHDCEVIAQNGRAFMQQFRDRDREMRIMQQVLKKWSRTYEKWLNEPNCTIPHYDTFDIEVYCITECPFKIQGKF